MTGKDTPSDAADGSICAANGFYELLDYDGVADIPADAGVDNGLLAVGSTGAIVLTGTVFGPVALRVEIHSAPPPLEANGWEKIVEAEQYTPSGVVSVNSPLGDAPEDLPALRTAPDSWYRIRVYARGIEQARTHADAVEEPVEHHLVQLWPTDNTTGDADFPDPARRPYELLHPRN